MGSHLITSPPCVTSAPNPRVLVPPASHRHIDLTAGNPLSHSPNYYSHIYFLALWLECHAFIRAGIILIRIIIVDQRCLSPSSQPTTTSSHSPSSSSTMVKVEIVEEKDPQSVSNNSPYASTTSSRTSSSVSLSSVGSELDAEESFYDRLTALIDIVPPTTRQKISNRVSKTASVVKTTGKVVGNLIWIVTTSALLVGLPLALSLEDEAKIVAQEKEMLAQQQGAQQVGVSPFPPSLPISCQTSICSSNPSLPRLSAVILTTLFSPFYLPDALSVNVPNAIRFRKPKRHCPPRLLTYVVAPLISGEDHLVATRTFTHPYISERYVPYIITT